MFCPECGYEYRQGFTECSDCRVPLVHELPSSSEPGLDFVDFREVLFTFNPADIAIIKSVLDSEEITYFFKGEHFNYVRPLAEPARLMVREDQVREAKEILEDLRLSIVAASPDDEQD